MPHITPFADRAYPDASPPSIHDTHSDFLDDRGPGHTHRHAILIHDEDGADEYRHAHFLERRATSVQSIIEHIEANADNVREINDLGEEEFEANHRNDLRQGQHTSYHRESAPSPGLNNEESHHQSGPIQPRVRGVIPHIQKPRACDIREELIYNGLVINIGDLVQIPSMGKRYWYCAYLKVQGIYQAPDGMRVRGIPYTRQCNTLGLFDNGRNEIVPIYEMDEEDSRDMEAQAVVEVYGHDIKAKREHRMTSHPWPEFCISPEDFDYNVDRMMNEGPLMQRWKLIVIYGNIQGRRKSRPVGMTMVSVRTDTENCFQACQYHLSPEERLLNRWRGGSQPDIAIDLDNQGNQSNNRRQGRQQYTMGDIFSGCGGASCGARAAGFRPTFAVDFNENACATYQHNFRDVKVYHDEIFNVLQTHSKFRVDVLHISFPCQFWSPAHTQAGKDDEMNMSILFSCFEIIKCFRPRIVTVEQTFGLLYSEGSFHTLLNAFTQNGYSVSWRFVHLSTWGVPQPRKRLIIIASCPGERLPEMPGPRGDTVSVDDALRTIVPGQANHDPEAQLARAAGMGFPRPPWDSTGLAPLSMTTGGGGEKNYHPTGERPLTLREFMSLQTFPPDFEVIEPYGKKQIGNAFPPAAVEWLYCHILEHLRREDSMLPAIPPAAEIDLRGDVTMREYGEVEEDLLPGSQEDFEAAAAKRR